MRATPILVAIALAAAPAMAGMIAYDSFTGAGPLEAHAPELGLGIWDDQGTGYSVVEPGLQFGALQVTGGKAIGGNAYQAAGTGVPVPAPSDADNGWETYRKQGPTDVRYRAGKEGTTLWASFLIEDWKDNDGNRVRFTDNINPIHPGSYGVGVVVNGGNWQLRDIASGSFTDTGVARNLNEAYLMVVKFEFLTGEEYPGSWANGADDITLYVNPTPGLAAPDVGGTTMTSTTDVAILSVYFYPGSGTNEGAMDELRFGDSYADVTPIPEPATMALVALGGLTPLLRRRR